ncbi:MAG: hypothetical protein M1840_001546 [Geoglossum simile]|nr:MAG: hypothetical protein M1840_001546 [Geoglossum simile]
MSYTYNNYQSTPTSSSSSSDSDPPFLNWDGTCGPNPRYITAHWKWVVFILGNLITLVVTAGFNLYRGHGKERRELFSKYLAIQGFATAIAQMIGVAVGIGLVRGTYSDTSQRAAFWSVFLGPHPGCIMLMMQLLMVTWTDNKGWAHAALSQTYADCLLTLIGLGNIWAGEKGSSPQLAVRGQHTTVIVAAWMYGISLVLAMLLPAIYGLFGRKAFGASGRLIFFACGLFSFIAGTILVIVGAKLCGEAFAWTDVAAGGFLVLFAAILLCVDPAAS